MTTISVIPSMASNNSIPIAATTTITVPNYATSMVVKLWGAGGSGAGGASSYFGGGGGGYAIKTVSVVPGQTYTISIGQPKNGSIGQTGGTFISGSGGGMSMLHSLIAGTYSVLAVAGGGGGAGGGGISVGAVGGGGGASGGVSVGTGGTAGSNGNGGGGGINGGGTNGVAGTNFNNTSITDLANVGGIGGNGAFLNTGSGYASGNGGDGYGGGGGGSGIFSTSSFSTGGGGGGLLGDAVTVGSAPTPGNTGDADFPGTSYAYGGGGGAVDHLGKPGYAVVKFNNAASSTINQTSSSTVINGNLILATSGGIPATLNYYETYTHNTTWNGAYGNNTVLGNVILTRIGNTVTALFPQILGTCASGNQLWMMNNAPFRFNPPSNLYIVGGIAQTASGTLNPNGIFFITTGGNYQFHNSTGQTFSNSGSPTVGLAQASCVSWIV